jgi:polyphosphate kinase 2 (PPK2 family)
VHKWIDEDTVKKRMEHINHFEKLIQDNNTIILKFYMHVSPEKQLERLDERKTNLDEMWKHNANDYEERKLWNEYMKCYEDAFNTCNSPEWNIIPTDNNWYKEYLISKICVEALEKLNMKYPDISL